MNRDFGARRALWGDEAAETDEKPEKFSFRSIDFFTARDFVQLQLRLYLNREGALTTSRGFSYVL
jgi:hypothetical protein